MRKIAVCALALFIINASGFAQEKIDPVIIEKIKNEGLKNSKVMDIAFQLTDVNGPRLTGSPGLTNAGNWALKEMASWGVTGGKLEPWGTFGKGWDLKKSYVAMNAPYYKPLIAYPKTWTKGTGGLKKADILLVKAKDSAELQTYAGKMKGKVILLYRQDTLKPSYQPDAVRYTDDELYKMAAAEAPAAQQARPMTAADSAAMRQRFEAFRRNAGGNIAGRVKEMATKEGALALLSMSPRGHEGTLFVQGGGSYAADAPENMTDLMLTFEDYMTFCRLANAGIPVSLEMDVVTAFHQNDLTGYNVIAEIKGTDPKLKDEIVMLGGHLDSWHGSTGATDNAAGCAVMMEAMRIIKAIGIKPKRTIRIALWSGEEQGLLGSRAYVKNHFADPATMKLLPNHEKLSAYYNIDNGTGKIRGIYTQGNVDVKDIFANWLLPFHDMGAKTVTVSNTGGTDHQSFDAVGLPGFQFIQDEIEYDTRTHHTNMDSYDHLQAADLQQMSVIVASFVYQTAMRDAKIPRKPLPAPRGAGGRMF